MRVRIAGLVNCNVCDVHGKQWGDSEECRYCTEFFFFFLKALRGQLCAVDAFLWKTRRSSPIETGRHDGENVPPFLISGQTRSGKENIIIYDQFSFRPAFLSHVSSKYVFRFILNFLPMRSQVLAVLHFKRKFVCLKLQANNFVNVNFLLTV